MNKFLKTAFLCIALIMSIVDAYCQQIDRVSDELLKRLDMYCKSYPREEVYIQTDREEYIAGENIWINASVFSRGSNLLSGKSGLVYFEVLNKDYNPVIQTRIRIENGIGPGQVLLPDTLSTGPYLVRAYTNLMKNFLPENCFMKEIKVFNALNTKSQADAYYLTNRFQADKNSAIKQAGSLDISVSESLNGIRELIIQTGSNYTSSNSIEFLLIIETRGKIYFSLTGILQSETTRIPVPEKFFTPGINHIAILNSKGKPLVEKYVYTPVKKDVILISGLSDIYEKREKISFSVSGAEAEKQSVKNGNITISVVKETSGKKGISLTDYLIFGSEFGMAPFEFLNGRNMADLRVEEINILLQNLKSNWIDWDKIATGNYPELKFQTEEQEHYLPGKVLTGNNQEADSGEYVFMSVPGKKALFQYAKTDGNGNFVMKISIDEKLNDLIIQPDKIDGGRRIKIESPFSDKHPASELVKETDNSEIPVYLKQWGSNYQISKIYETSSYGEPLMSKYSQVSNKRFYGKPDFEILLDDYIKLPVMEEIFFELIPGAFMKKKKTSYEISMSDPVDNRIYDYPPGMFVDGVIVKDPSVIGNLDPETVEKIDVVKDKYYVGSYLFFGIINIITGSGDFSNVVLPDYATRFSYRVVEPVPLFLSPEYSLTEMKNSRIPDFRNTLWWSPSLNNNDGKVSAGFWTSDIPGSYLIIIQGFTSDGNAFSVTKPVLVK